MSRRRVFLLFNLLQVVVLAVLLAAAAGQRRAHERRELPAARELVRRLRLTDLSVWTEARYTRHPSQADRFAPFQDLPSSLEHFPSGSIVEAPAAAGPAPRP